MFNRLKMLALLGFIFIFVFSSEAVAKVNAKDVTQNATKEFIHTIAGANANSVPYTCIGDERQATCTIKSLNTEGVRLNDVKISSIIESKSASFTILGNANMTAAASEKDFMITKFNCKSSHTLTSSVLANSVKCAFSAPSYTLNMSAVGDLISSDFSGKEIDKITDIIADTLNNKNQNVNILQKEIVLLLDAPKLGDAVYNAQKADNPALTREQFNAQIQAQMNVLVASAPLTLGKDTLSNTQLIQSIASLGRAGSSLLTGKKKSIELTLRRKSGKPVPLNTFLQNLNATNATSILKDYDVMVK